MSVPHGSSAALLFDGYILTSFAKNAKAEPTQDVHDSTVFGQAARTKLPGLKHGTFSAEMFFDNTTVTGSWAIVQGKYAAQSPGTNAPATISFAPQGFSLGSQVSMMYAATISVVPKSIVDDLTMLTLSAESSEDAVDLGVSLHALTAETGSGNGTSVDGAAATTNGGVGALHVTALAGAAPSVVIKVQHSTDDSTWVDLITWSATTAANTTQRTEVAAGTTIRRYLRIVCTFGGTTTSITFNVNFARR